MESAQCQEEGSYTLGRAPAISLGQARIRGPGGGGKQCIWNGALGLAAKSLFIYQGKLKSENT